MSPTKWLWRPAQSTTPELWLQVGLLPAQVKQLVALTQTDPLIAQTTHDLGRFKDSSAVEEWLRGPREVVVMLDASDQLLGIVWVSQKNLPSISETQLLPTWQEKIKQLDVSQYNLTFGIRLYAQARGKGLSAEFFRSAFDYFTTTGRFKGKLWLQTKSTNQPAIKAYRKLHFHQISGPDQEQEICMIQL